MKTKSRLICAIAIAVVLFAGSGMVYPTAESSVYAKTSASKIKVLAPQGLKAVRAGDTSLELSWKKSTNATGYTVYRSNPKTNNYKAVKTLGKGALSWTNENLESDAVYSYKIRAFAKKNGKKIFSPYTYIVTAVPYTSKSKKVNVKKLDAGYTSRFLGLNGAAKVMNISIEAPNDKDPVSSKLVWTSSDTSIVTVDKNGWLKAKKKKGTAKVYVRSHNGITKTLTIKVGDYANPKSFSNLGKLNSKTKATINKNKDAMCRVAAYLSQFKTGFGFFRGVKIIEIKSESIKKDLLQLLKTDFSYIEQYDNYIMFKLDGVGVVYYYRDFNGPQDSSVKLAPCWFYDLHTPYDDL